MTTRMLVDGLHEEETRVVIADDDNLIEFDVESSSKKQTKGNVYLAKVTRVEPSLQAAFVEYGSERQGFLPFSEIHPDYYQIPVADKEQLIEEQRKEDEAEAKEEEAAAEKKSKSKKSDEEPEEGVEELESDDDIIEQPRRHKVKRYKIQEVVKKNQVILIQVIKEERGNKGASVTSYISLPGKYCVLMPNSTKGGGVSRKIGDVKERKRLKSLVEGLDIHAGMSIILRTAGLDRTKAEITRDYNYLIRLWNTIREQTLSSVAPSLVYEEASVIKRSLRDLYNSDIKEVYISGDNVLKTAKEFMKMIMPSHAKNVKEYKESTPIFNHYGIEPQLAAMYDPIVAMRSGGYIVINSTEAMISIDVNSGRSTGGRNVEDTATATNIEAAEEIARQLKLRDLAGLVVIDFIDMVNHRHRRQVERALKDALKHDRAKIQVGRISPFGLLEMSRQRLRPSITEINMVECPSCKGVGIIRSDNSAMVQLVRAIENELTLSDAAPAKVTVTTSPQLALHFLNNKRKRIAELEEEYNFELVMETEDLPPAAFKLQLEDIEGNKLKMFSSEDRDRARLPHSVEGGNRRRRDNRRGKKGGRDRDNNRDRGNFKNKKAGSRADNRDKEDDKANDQVDEVEAVENKEATPAAKESGGKKKPAPKKSTAKSKPSKKSDEAAEDSKKPAKKKPAAKKPAKSAKKDDEKAEIVELEAPEKTAPAKKDEPLPEDIVDDKGKKRSGWWRK